MMSSSVKDFVAEPTPRTDQRRTKQEVFAAALALHQEDRAELAAQLLESLEDGAGEDPNEIELAWENEIARRIEEVDAGRMKTVSWDEVQARLRAIVERPRER